MVLSEIRDGFFAGAASESSLSSAIQVFGLACFVVAALPLGFLCWKPRWWGKLVLPVYGFSWMLHAAMIQFMSTLGVHAMHVPAVWIPAACGALMIALAITHQLIDRNFGAAERGSSPPP